MRKVIAAATAGLLVFAACGGGSDEIEGDPKEALIEATADLVETKDGGDGLTTTFTFESNEESIQALIESGGEQESVPENIESLLLDSAVVFSFNVPEKLEDGRGEFLLDLAGQEAVQMVVDGYDIYARADVRYLVETFGGDVGEMEEGLAEAPPGLEFLQDAVDGDWVHITGLEAMYQQFAAPLGGEAPGLQDLAEQQARIVDELKRLLEENSEVTQGEEEGPGAHLEMKVDVAGFGEDFTEVITDLGSQFGQQVPPGPSEGDLPEGEMIVDAWVDGDELKQIEIDFIKNASFLGEEEDIPEGVDEFAIRFAFEDFDGDVDIPSDSIEVSAQELFTAFAGAAMESFGDSGTISVPGGPDDATAPPDDFCKEIADLPPDQQEPFTDICPEL